MQELDDYINKVKHLPPAPRVLPELLVLLNDEDADADRIVTMISYDPSITASVLQLCNSAFYSPSQPIGDLSQAVTWLGFKQIYQLVTAVLGARTICPEQKGYGYAKGELWRHTVATAVGAQVLARKLEKDDENTVFTAALLHDVGKIVLSEALEHIYAKLVEETQRQLLPLLSAEKQLLGVQHAEIGGRLLSRWKFPAAIVSAVWWHHQPQQAQPHHRLAAYIYLGNLIAHMLDRDCRHPTLTLKGRPEALDILGLSPETLPHYMIETVEQLALVSAMFHGLARTGRTGFTPHSLPHQREALPHAPCPG